jgi:hypothetical protein
MEEVLDVYTTPYNPEEPLICMDEAVVELQADVVPSLALEPGQDAKEDYHYDRRGTRPIFLFIEPFRSWRRVKSYEHRTRIELAHEIRHVLDVEYPNVRKVKLICDNLNTHHISSLYETFPAEEAHRLARRLEIHYTPRNGNWLNIAEIELSVLHQQCLDRRISDEVTLEKELQAWQQERNQSHAQVKWQFSTEDARIKLHHLYPQF